MISKPTKSGNQSIGFSDLKKIFQSIPNFIFVYHSAIIFLLVFIINFLLVSPSLMPRFTEINPDDQAKYVESGWRLLRGDIRDLAWGPMVSLIYAPLHLIVGDSLDWFLLETWLGGFLLYSFLWWTTFYLAYQFKAYLSPYIMLGVLFVSTPLFSVLRNQSDAVFLGFSALALAQLIKFYQDRKLKDLGIASLMVGLGILARVETIILVATLAIIGIIIGRIKYPLYKILLSSLLPALCVLGIFFFSSLILVGDLNLGLAYKSYDSFEMNQAILTGGDIELARQETRRLFGIQEENQGSVLRAILRNPSAFTLRILANAKTIPESYFDFFGKKMGALLLFFAAWGMYGFYRKKAIIPLLILLLWPLHAFVYLGFLSLHIIPQVSYLPLLLGAVGIAGIFSPDFPPRQQGIVLLSSILILILSWITEKPAFFFGFLLLVFVLLLFRLFRLGLEQNHPAMLVPLLLLLAAGLVLRDPFPFPNYPVLGTTADEQAVYYLEEFLPSQTTILAPSPLPALAAKLSYLTMDDIPEEITSLQDFSNWLKQQDVRAILLDSNHRVRNDIYDLMEEGYSPYFSSVYASADNKFPRNK